MKYLLVLAVVLVAIHIWRSNRRERPQAPPPPKRPRTLGTPEAMARCAHCGMHLPAAEGVEGRRKADIYCSVAHREQAEG